MNFRYRLLQFMSGRYGIDKLFYFLFSVAALFSFINIFLRSGILQIIVYLIVVFAFCRVLSRNHTARSAENRWIENLLKNINKKVYTARQRKADITHIYKKCPKCKAVLRLPRRVGKHTTVCPKCNNSFKVVVRK